MKLSTKSRYGTRAMIDIALNHEEKPISLKDLAQRQGVSVKYLEQIISSLRAAGFIRSIRGVSGGYVLAKSPNKITLLDIIQALEGSLSPVDCVDMPKICPRSNECVAHDIWGGLYEAINKNLSSQTLTEVAGRQRQKLEKKNRNKK